MRFNTEEEMNNYFPDGVPNNVLGIVDNPPPGTFKKVTGVNWPRSYSGIPTGWTVIDM